MELKQRIIRVRKKTGRSKGGGITGQYKARCSGMGTVRERVKTPKRAR